jgi:hypothetical protein
MAFRIVTQVIELETVLISIIYGGKPIGAQIMELSFNADESPTFCNEDGYVYESEEFAEFIQSIQDKVSHAFTFASSLFFGLLYKVNDEEETLEFVFEQFTCKLTVIIDLKEGKDLIIHDLNSMRKTLDSLVKSRREYYDTLKPSHISSELMEDA